MAIIVIQGNTREAKSRHCGWESDKDRQMKVKGLRFSTLEVIGVNAVGLSSAEKYGHNGRRSTGDNQTVLECPFRMGWPGR